MVEKLGTHGCILSGKDIARHLGNLPTVYGVRYPAQQSDTQVYHVDIIQQSEGIDMEQGSVWKPGMSMPNGWYDGTRSTSVQTKSNEGVAFAQVRERGRRWLQT